LEALLRLKLPSITALGVVAIALGALAVAACSSDVSKSDLDTTNTRIDQLQAQTTKAQMLSASNTITAAGLHDLDETINAADAIDASWVSRATRARRAVASVTWPDKMKEPAATLLASLTDLETALNDENLPAAKTAASAAHENSHELDHMAAPYLADETPAPEATTAASAAATTAAAH
jgi:hypothetical protein